MSYTISQFRKDYPNDDVCLTKLFQLRYSKMEACPECGVIGAEFKRICTRRCFQCVECGHQLYPTAGTIFEKTTTPLTYWFYAMYAMIVTRNGVAAKELQRVLGLTYKTAWRMAHHIRILMSQRHIEMLKGEVMIDETFIGGQEKFKHRTKRNNVDGYMNRTPVFGMMEKGTNKIITKVMKVEEIKAKYLRPIISENVDKDSVVVTDMFRAYMGLDKEFKQHETINHAQEEYVSKNGFTTNDIEAFWSSLKRMIKGTHIHVSVKHLPKYIAENTFRYENRNNAEKMFDIMLSQVA